MKKTYNVHCAKPFTQRHDRKGFSDSVDVECSVVAQIPKGHKVTNRLIAEVIQYRAKHGRNPKGFRVELTRWRNPDRFEGEPDEVFHNPEAATAQKGWRKYGSQRERWDTLNRALRSPSMVFTVTEHRTPRRKKRRKKTVHRPRPRAR